jgi:pimeloyl-ACP methyl ester carboxylesterase
VLDYDPRLSETLASLYLAAPPPTLWPQFDALAGVPVMVIRGANSDILSEATVSAMAARRTELVSRVVPDEGHVPLLNRSAVLNAISAFMRACTPAPDLA